MGRDFLIPLLIFLSIMIIYIIYCRNLENNLLEGFWVIDDEFKRNAELTMFILYIGSYNFSNRNGYIIARNNDGLIMNNAISMNITNYNFIYPFINDSTLYINIDWLNQEHSDETFPSKLQAKFYPINGKLILYNDDTTLAILYKNNQMSSIKKNLVPEELINENKIQEETN
jgi:hypothetical protein